MPWDGGSLEARLPPSQLPPPADAGGSRSPTVPAPPPQSIPPAGGQAATASALDSARCRRRRRRSIIMVFTCSPNPRWTRMLLPLGLNGKVGSPDAHLGCSPDSAHMTRPTNMGGNSRRCSAEPLSPAAPASSAWRRGLSTAAAKCTGDTTDGCRTRCCRDGFLGCIRRSRP